MKIAEKKHYISPRVKAVKLDDTIVLAGSDLTSGGDNSQPGAPTTAESKHSSMWFYDDDGYEE